MIFYEAPHKLRATLDDLAEALGPDRTLAVCRELTKLHEEVLRLTIGEAQAHYAQQEPRGEFVLVAAGCPPQEEGPDEEAALALVEQLRAEGLSLKDAVGQAAEGSGLKKRRLYGLALDREKSRF